jgi:hypothetical protein
LDLKRISIHLKRISSASQAHLKRISSTSQAPLKRLSCAFQVISSNSQVNFKHIQSTLKRVEHKVRFYNCFDTQCTTNGAAQGTPELRVKTYSL